MKKFKIKRAFKLLAICLMAISMAGCCCIWMPGSSYAGALPALSPKLVEMSAELRRDLVTLSVGIGERNLHNRPDNLIKARDWIEQRLKADGHQVSSHEFSVFERARAHNVIAEIRGSEKPNEIVVVGAHYDTVTDCPGANDNGTGVVSLLQLSKLFKGAQPKRTLRLVAFANEEPPYFQTESMGSLAYARLCRKNNDDIVAMISLETMGFYSDEAESQAYPAPLDLFYPSKGNFIVFVGNTGSMFLTRHCVELFRGAMKFPSEGAALPASIPGVGWSDHWSFWQVGYNAVMVTDTAPFRYEHYHERGDTVDKVNFDRLAMVTLGCYKVIESLLAE